MLFCRGAQGGQAVPRAVLGDKAAMAVGGTGRLLGSVPWGVSHAGSVSLLHLCLRGPIATVAARPFDFITWVLHLAWGGCPGMLCSHRVTQGRTQGHRPTGPCTQDPLGLCWGITPGREHSSSPACPLLLLGGHGEANTVSCPVQHVETINNLT